MPPTVTAVVVAKNEEKILESCLKALNWVDELIIIDNFSTDKTPKIGKKYADKFFIRKGGKYDAVTNNKNFGFEQATSDWVLSIDADEIITEECKNEILQKIKENKYTGFYFNFKQIIFGKEFIGPLWTKTKIIRLFKRNKGKYSSLYSHLPIKVNGIVGRVTKPILHNGYPDIDTFVRKTNYYTTFEAQLLYDGKLGGLLKKPIKKINTYYLFIEPVIFLPYYFIIKKNYKDGIHGLILSILISFYLFIERAKLWQLQYERKNKKNI